MKGTIVAILVLTSVVFSGRDAQAQGQGCSVSSLKGAYGFTEVGAPWNVSGLLKFDGKGSLTYDWTIVYSDGSVGSGTETWPYEVRSDCRFTMTNNLGQQYFGVIVLDARELHWVISTEGFVAKGDARKVRTE